MLQQMFLNVRTWRKRNWTDTHTVTDICEVGGRARFSEELGVRWWDQWFDAGQQLSPLSVGSSFPANGSKAATAPMCQNDWWEKTPSPFPPINGFKQFAACQQLMRRKYLPWTIKWKDYGWLHNIWVLRRKKAKHNHHWCTAFILERWNTKIRSLEIVALFLLFQDRQGKNILSMFYTCDGQTDIFHLALA